MKKIICIILGVALLVAPFQMQSMPVYGASTIPTVYISGSAANGYGHDVTFSLTSPATENFTLSYQVIQGSAHGTSAEGGVVSDGIFINAYADPISVSIGQGQTSKTVSLTGYDPGTSYEESQRVYFVQLIDVTGNAVIDKSQDVAWLYHKEGTNTINYGTHILAEDSNTYQNDNDGLIARLPSGGISWETSSDPSARYWPLIGVNQFTMYLDSAIRGEDAWAKMYFDVNGDNGGHWYERDYDSGVTTLGERIVDGNDIMEAAGYSSSAEALWGGDFCQVKYIKIYGAPVDNDSPDVDHIMHVTGNYGEGQSVIIAVMFDEIVRVDAGQTPSLPIVDNAGNILSANYVTGSGTDVLVFSYPVQGWTQADQLKLRADNPFYGEGYVKDIAGNPMDQSTFAAHLGADGLLDAGTRIDASLPQILSYTANKSNTTLTQDDTVDITVTFNKTVKILGNAYLSLNNGGKALRNATSAAAAQHTFRYTVGSGSTVDMNNLSVTGLQSATVVDGFENVGVGDAIPTNIHTQNIDIDNTAPVISIEYITDQNAPAQSHQIKVTATDNLAGINPENAYEYSIGSATYISTDQLGQILTVSESNPVSVYVRVRDAAGNTATAVSDTLFMDKTAPTVSLGYPQGYPQAVGSIDVTVSDVGGMPDAVTYTWYGSGGQVMKTGQLSGYFGSATVKRASILDTAPDGLYRLVVNAVDLAGNETVVNDDANPSYIYIDKSKPAVSVLPSDTRQNLKTYAVTVSATDSNGVNEDGQVGYISYKWDNAQTAGSWQSVSSDSVTFNHDNGGLTGEAVLSLKIGDSAGQNGTENITETSYTFTFDHTGPSISIAGTCFNSVNNLAEIDVQAWDTVIDTGAQTAASYVYYAITGSIDPASVQEWQLLDGAIGRVSKSSGNGDYYIHVKAIDAVGNESLKTSDVFTMDTQGAEGTLDIIEQNTSSQTVELQLTSDDPGVRYELSEDGSNYDGLRAFEGAAVYTFSDTAEGVRTIYARFVDGADNITYASDTVILDRTAPTGEVAYDIQTLTNASVTASLVNLNDAMTSSGNLIVSESAYEFTGNGSHIFEIRDEAGNVGYVTAEVDWIDKVKPTVIFSPESDPTRANVKEVSISAVKEAHTVTLQYRLLDESLTVIKPYEAAANPVTLSLDEANPVYVEVLAVDEIGNESLVRSGLFGTDNLPPVAQINYSTTRRTANDVYVTISFDEVAEITNNGGSNAYTFIENGAFEFTFTDSAGNEGSAVATVDYIDRSIPTAQIGVSTEAIVDTDVIVTVTVEDLPNAKIVSAALEGQPLVAQSVQTREVSGQQVVWQAVYAVENNGFVEVLVTDVDTGQSSVASISISNIDKKPPVFSYFLNATDPTKEDLVMTITYSDEMSEPVTLMTDLVAEADGSYIIRDNGTYVFTLEDALGNSVVEEVVIEHIDREFAPYVTYDVDTFTNLDVTASVVSDDEEVYIVEEDGSAGVLATYVFEENGTYNFDVRDQAGNTATVEAVVDWIDKVGEDFTIEASTKEKVNVPISLSVGPAETLIEVVSHENLTTVDEQFNVFSVTENGVYHFTTTDIYGNVKEISHYIGNVDTTPPLLDYVMGLETAAGRIIRQAGEPIDIACSAVRIDFSDEEVYDFTAYDSALEYDGGAHAFTVRADGTYTFTARDIAGNESTKTVTVAGIDTTPPSVTAVYSITETTSEPVVVTLSSDEEVLVVNNFNVPYRLFTANESFTFMVSDKAGNQTEVIATVANIDRTPPVVKVTYSTSDRTRNAVTVSLTSDELFHIYDGGWKSIEVGSNHSYTFSYNHAAFFRVKDSAGNETTVYASVSNIDLTAPNISFISEWSIVVPTGDTAFDFAGHAYTDSGDFTHFTIDSSGVDFTREGIYQVTYTAFDNVGNSREATKQVEVLDYSKPLIVRINGENPAVTDYFRASEIGLELLNVQMSSSVYYLEGKESVTRLKQTGKVLSGLTLPVERSGWYSILVVDKDMNRRHYQIFVAR